MNESSPLLSIEIQPTSGNQLEEIKNISSDMIYFSSTANVLVSFICGVFYMVNFVNIGLLADKLDTTAVKLGSVFIGEAVAAVIGGLFWPTASHTFGTAEAMVASLVLLAVVCIAIMTSSSILLMYFLYFFAGLLTSFADTATAATMRVIHKGDHRAGPWLTAMAAAFLIGGMFAVFLNAVLNSIFSIYMVVLLMISGVAGFTWLHQDRSEHTPAPCLDQIVLSSYIVEIIIGLTMGLVDGSSTVISSYLETYIVETGVVADNLKSYVVLVFWLAMLVGEMLVLFTQTKQTTQTLLIQQAVAAGVSVTALGFLAIFSNSGVYLWFAMAIVGVCNAMSFCLLSDLANRLCRPTALSGTIIFFGVSLGISGLPYVASAVWEYTDAGPCVLIYLLMGFQGLTLLVQIAPSYQYVEL